jgi:hypothetical protein
MPLSLSHKKSAFVELSLSPFFQRKWPSLYEAFEDGLIDRKRLQKAFVQYLPAPSEGKRLVLGVDATPIARPDSVTSADRTALPMHNIPHAAPKKSRAITFGWKYSTLVVLPDHPSSETFILDQQRISSDQTDSEVALSQLKEMVPKLSGRPLVLLDRGYVALVSVEWIAPGCADPAQNQPSVLSSSSCSHRQVWTTAASDGAKLKLDQPSTQTDPDETWKGTDASGHPVEMSWWKNMHAKDARWLKLTIIRVSRPHAEGSERDPRISWFVYIGQDPPEGLAQVAFLYCLRFGQEHGYRFDKQALLWTEARLRTPEQFDRWTETRGYCAQSDHACPRCR